MHASDDSFLFTATMRFALHPVDVRGLLISGTQPRLVESFEGVIRRQMPHVHVHMWDASRREWAYLIAPRLSLSS